MLYKKLKRTWSHGYANYIPRMREVFPELSKLSNEEMCDRWIALDIEFYTIKEIPVKWWIRLTLPFALLFMLLLMFMLPIYFIVTGTWGYDFTNKNKIYNWFKSLKLL